MNPDFHQVEWNAETIEDCRQIIRLAVREDLGCGVDLTTVSVVSPEARGSADLVMRRAGVLAGLRAVPVLIDEMQLNVACESNFADGNEVEEGVAVATLHGSTRDLLTSERILLNLVGRLTGIASFTRRFVQAIAGTGARVYDTRKTTPGWRRMEKYAVRCGGGSNHRTGLFDAILIKDNHLAQSALAPGEAVTRAREFLAKFNNRPPAPAVPIEIEVDTLDQLRQVLPFQPDIVLLDNMTVEQLRTAVQLRDQAGAKCELEASGGVRLDTIRDIAETGVERISVGALTHSAAAHDVALDWRDRAE